MLLVFAILASCSVGWGQEKAVQNVVVYLATVDLSPKGDSLRFSPQVVLVSNFDEVQSGQASTFVFQPVDNTDGLRLRYAVTTIHESGELQSGTVAYDPGSPVQLQLPGWDTENDKLRLQVSVLNGAGWNDVTAQVNATLRNPEGMQLGVAEVGLIREKPPFDPMYLGVVYRWFRDSVERGGAISVLLLFVILPWGIAVSAYHVGRLFLSARWSRRSIRRSAETIFSVNSANGQHSSALDELVRPIERQITVALRRRRGDRVHRMELKAWERMWMARISEAASELVVARVRTAPAGSRFKFRFFDFLPVSLDSLWNAAILAPLLGLLGTVVGISSSFGRVNAILVSQGAKKAMSALSSGINTALYTTVDGLAVGIVLMLFYYICQRRAKAIIQSLESSGRDFWQQLMRRLIAKEIQVVE